MIIGEVTLNLEDFLSAGDTGPLFLPLQKCDSGTTLQVKLTLFMKQNLISLHNLHPMEIMKILDAS